LSSCSGDWLSAAAPKNFGTEAAGNPEAINSEKDWKQPFFKGKIEQEYDWDDQLLRTLIVYLPTTLIGTVRFWWPSLYT
jgi:hypothetical protein